MIYHNRSWKKVLMLTMTIVIIYSRLNTVSNASPGTVADTDFPLFLVIDDTPGFSGGDSTFIFTDHTSTLESGNWIQLSGGTQTSLPEISFNIDFPSDSTTTVNGNDVSIDSYQSEDQFDYPLSQHSTYLTGQTVTANFYGSSNNADDTGLQWRLIQSSNSQIADALSSAFNGDASDLVTLISSGNTDWEEAENLDGSGNAATSFSAPASGNYCLFLVAETTSPYQLVIYGSTIVEVLEYTLTTTVPASLIRGSYLDLDVEITNPPGSTDGIIYGATIINEAGYVFDVDVISDSTISGTVVEINGEIIVEGSGSLGTVDLVFPGISSLSTLNVNELSQKITSIISGNNIALGFSDEITQYSTIVSLSTSSLNLGTYNVLIGVWEDDVLSGFITDAFILQAPSSSGGSSGGGSPTPPPVTDIKLLSPSEAANILKGLTALDAADLLMQVTSLTHVTDIITLLEPAYAAQVLSNMTPTLIGQLMEIMDETVLFDIVKTIDNDSAQLLISMFDQNSTMTTKLVEEAVKSLIEGLNEAERISVLSSLSEALATFDTDNLVELLIQISQMPETPSTVAFLLESMDFGRVLEAVSHWISLEDNTSFNDLANVYSFFSDSFLERVYRGMSNPERLSIYPYFSSNTVFRLPAIGEFQISSLKVLPDSVEPNTEVVISFTIRNVGSEVDDYVVSLRVNDEIVETFEGLLEAGVSLDLSHTLMSGDPGVYTVMVENESVSFTVIDIEPDPANLQVLEVRLDRDLIMDGDSFTVFVTVVNEGGREGTETFELLIDWLVVDSMDVSLLPGADFVLQFDLVANYGVGDHDLLVQDNFLRFNISKSPSKFPGLTVISFAVIILAGAGYLYYQRMQKK